jgi:uncharacterized membrane protein
MSLSIAEVFLLCWAITVTGFYFVERKNHRKFAVMTISVLRAVATNKASVTITNDGSLDVQGEF